MVKYSREWWQERIKLIQAFVDGALILQGKTVIPNPVFDCNPETYSVGTLKPYTIENPEVLKLLDRVIYRRVTRENIGIVRSIAKTTVVVHNNGGRVYCLGYEELFRHYSLKMARQLVFTSKGEI